MRRRQGRKGESHMRKMLFVVSAGAALVGGAQIKSPETGRPAPPPPTFRPALIRADEKPVAVDDAWRVAEDNGLLRRVEVTLTFTNPNGRVFDGELEFPLPEGAVVCGYDLEIDGSFVPGVVCEKETARTAFENERRKGVDPGVVEHVKGNVWRTRIYPLRPKTPRRARVAYVEVVESAAPGLCVVESDGGEVFVATAAPQSSETRADRLRKAVKARIWWDASMSRHGRVAPDRELLGHLPERGDFALVVFRNAVEPEQRFSSRADLLSAIDSLVYDGGTCLEVARRRIEDEGRLGECFLFTDEVDVDAAERRRVRVRRLSKGEAPPAEPRPGRLLATQWAADYIADHSADAASRRAEFLSLGRRYGVASSVTSLIVLETLEQYVAYKVEPPKSLAFHGEWVERRAAEDDAIAAAKAKAEHMKLLLGYWEERVNWWNNPMPPKRTPKSGLFDSGLSRSTPAASGEGAVDSSAVVLDEESPAVARSLRGRPAVARSLRGRERFAEASAPGKAKQAREPQARQASATIKIAAWDPKTPYLDAIGAAKDAYGEYLSQREAHGNSPAFYLDCSGWFFKAGNGNLAKRIISNLSEMKLEDAGLWRTMGWRLREAGEYEEAIAAFRHVLGMRGEEPQSRRDLALVLSEAGKERRDAAMLAEAMRLLHSAAFEPTARRSGRRGNDMQTCVIALEELNGLLAWCRANGVDARAPEMDGAFRRDLPLALRVMLSWDVDETDVDLHVLEPNGEEAYYGHRRTSAGGFVSEDVTTGYGPEEYLRKTADSGVYRILANYFASHRQALTGAATVTATVYTDWGRETEKRKVFSFRLDKPKDKHPIGEVKIGE